MADPIRVLLSQTTFNTDGVTTVWNFSFSGGYLDQSHVKAQRRNTSTGAVTAITLTPGMFTGPYQLTLSPALAVGQELTIYRATPKEGPLVDFTDRAKLTEVSLDYSAKQAIFGVAEADDWRMVVSAAIEAVNIYQAAIATGPVASVNGRTGTVVLAKADVGLANVDNTSDLAKPVSTAQDAINRGPIFRLRGTAATSLTAGAFTLVTFSVKDFDPNNCATLSRFTPNLAGYYRVDVGLVLAIASTANVVVSLGVGGVPLRTLAYNNNTPAGASFYTGGSMLYFNGTTDFIEAYVTVSTAGSSIVLDTVSAQLYGTFVRPA